MTKPKRPITRLWYVGLTWDQYRPLVLVSEKPIERHCAESRRIRACTAKAAGRRYARNNVAAVLASSHFETDDGWGYGELTPEMVKKFKGKAKTAVVKVI